jgi:hypothetical protein
MSETTGAAADEGIVRRDEWEDRSVPDNATAHTAPAGICFFRLAIFPH